MSEVSCCDGRQVLTPLFSRQLDYDSVDYVSQLREAIIEADVGIVTGLKVGGQAALILPYVPSILDLLRRTVLDEERTETTFAKAMGLVGDLAEAFPNGELREQLLTEWLIANLLRDRPRLSTPEAKRTLKWAKEVSLSSLFGWRLGDVWCADCVPRRWSRKLLAVSPSSRRLSFPSFLCCRRFLFSLLLSILSNCF